MDFIGGVCGKAHPVQPVYEKRIFYASVEKNNQIQ